MNINTAIYVRVSTEEQALNGFSIRAQKEKLMYYATKIKDWNVYKVYSDEGISGKDIKNSELYKGIERKNTTSGLFPPRALRIVATLLIFTLNFVIFVLDFYNSTLQS